MTVFGGVLLFVSGVIVGGGAVAYNHYSVRRATSGLRKENERLKDAAWKDAVVYKEDRAYREGYEKGRRSPLSDVEKLADTMERRGVDFRGPRTVRKDVESDGQ